MKTTRETPKPDLVNPALRIVREDDQGNTAGFIHLDRDTKEPVAWSRVGDDGAISSWGWLVSGTTQPMLDPNGNPIEFVLGDRPAAVRARRSPRVAVALGVGAILVLAAAFGLGTQNSSENPIAEAPPSLDLGVSGPLVSDGSTFEFATLEGQDAVLFFYAPWCPHCQASGPVISSAVMEFGDQVQFVTISGSTDPNYPVPEYLAQFGLDGLTNVDDSGGKVFAHFGQNSVPAWLFINGDGESWIVPGRQPQEVIDENLQRLVEG